MTIKTDEEFLQTFDYSAVVTESSEEPTGSVDTPDDVSVEETQYEETPEETTAQEEDLEPEEETEELPADDGGVTGSEEQPATTGQEEVANNEGAENTAPELNVDELKAFRDAIMGPIKANGSTIELRDVGEAVRLIQMGANYTQKMQEISQHKKTLLMLEKNNLLDEEKLSFLIDLEKRNPEAIKKLMKDGEIDPLDIDVNSDVNYDPSSNLISDTEYQAKVVLEDLKSTPDGMETIRHIADVWDNDSINFMWSNPQAFKLIHEQRLDGTYDKIVQEISRQSVLGALPQGAGFLEMYDLVGRQLFGSPDNQANNHQNTPTKQPIETRVQTPTSSSNSQRARAASSPRATKRSSVVLEDLSRMNDSEFLEYMQGRN